MSKEKVNGYECVGVFKDENGNKIIKLVREDGQVSLIEYTGHVDDEITFDVHFKSDHAIALSQEFKDLLKEDKSFNMGDAVLISKEDVLDNPDLKLFEQYIGKTLYIVQIINSYDKPLQYTLSKTREPKTDDDIISFNDYVAYGFITSELKKEDNELNFGDAVSVDIDNLDPNHGRGDISELSGEIYFIVGKNIDFTGKVEYILGTKLEPETTDDKVMYNCWTPHTFTRSELKRV